MKRAHGVEGVGQVPRPGSERLPRVLVARIAVTEGDDAVGRRRFLHDSAGAIQFRRQGQHAQAPARGIRQPTEQPHVRRPQPAFGKSAGADGTDERPLQMDAEELGAVGHRPHRPGGGTQIRLALGGRVRHDAGHERGDALGHHPARVGAGLLGVRRRQREAAAAVDVDIDEARHQGGVGQLGHHRLRRRPHSLLHLHYPAVLDDDGAPPDLIVGRKDAGAGQGRERTHSQCQEAGL